MGKAWHATLGVVSVDARVEHVGSLPRPQFLREARDACARGELSPAGWTAAEDRAVRELAARREEAGLAVVGGGEMRCESFRSELTAACGGFTGVDVYAWLWGAWHSSEAGDVTIARPAGLAVIALLRKRRNLAAGKDVLAFTAAIHLRWVARNRSRLVVAEAPFDNTPPLRNSVASPRCTRQTQRPYATLRCN